MNDPDHFTEFVDSYPDQFLIHNLWSEIPNSDYFFSRIMAEKWSGWQITDHRSKINLGSKINPEDYESFLIKLKKSADHFSSQALHFNLHHYIQRYELH